MSMRIIIFGAGRVGRTLAASLLARKHKVTVVDNKRDVCDEVAAESDADVICGDATDPALLEELEVDNADYIFAVTGNEETNFLVSVYAKHANAEKVISRASEAKYSSLMERLGVEPIIPEMTLVRELTNHVLSPLITAMLDPNESQIEMHERDVEGSMDGKTVEEVSDKNDFTIISVFHDGRFLFPSADFKLEQGMKIVVVKHNV
jgi:trk system potassium uptake protein TrkA